MNKKITQREMEILRLIAQGFINKEISFRLGISKYTVDTHRKNIRSKLGASNTAVLLLNASKKGLI
jgi:DNA-binding NarL/FixJ family response regulator